MIFVYY